MQSFLLSCGMKVNIDKSFTLGFRPSGRSKINTVDIHSRFYVGDEQEQQREIRRIRREDSWAYLGVQFSWAGRKKIRPNNIIEPDLEVLKKSPLKPQQRLFAIRSLVIPKVYHQLALGSVMLGALKSSDITIRKAMRKWLNLPHDVPNAYFHAPIAEGGLGIPSLRWIAPLLRKNRLTTLRLGEDHPRNDFLEREITICEKRLRDGRNEFQTLDDVNKWWATTLHNTVDGGDLQRSAETPGQHRWVNDGTKFLSGRDYINSCRLRISALPTKSRTSRGRHVDRGCRAGCNAPETLNHVVQRCFRMQGIWIHRQDAVVKYVARRFENEGSSIHLEPRIQTADGLRKPDIIAIKGRYAIVVDAKVIGAQFNLRAAHRNKVHYYKNNPGIADYVTREYDIPRLNIDFGSATLNWKGVWAPESTAQLRGWGIVQKDLCIISSRIVIGGIPAFTRFKKIPARTPRERAGIG